MKEPTKWLHSLGDKVSLSMSEEEGIVIGAAIYLSSEPCYLIRYKAADGRLVENWWNESAIEHPF